MSKKVFIVHGWASFPEDGWFPWLRRELEKKGFDVHVPQLPEPETPKIEAWVPALAEAVGSADENTYFVGHSIGCQTIVRYLETMPPKIKVGGAVFVGGFFKRLTGLEEEGPEVAQIAAEWLGAPIDFEKVRSHLPKSAAIFSDNDYYVPLDNQNDFRDKLDSEIIIESGKGHFTGQSDGITELPSALEAVLKITGI